MDKAKVLKKLEHMEINARQVLNDIAALREELSGGSDSSISNQLSTSQKEQILKRRAKHRNNKS